MFREKAAQATTLGHWKSASFRGSTKNTDTMSYSSKQLINPAFTVFKLFLNTDGQHISIMDCVWTWTTWALPKRRQSIVLAPGDWLQYSSMSLLFHCFRNDSGKMMNSLVFIIWGRSNDTNVRSCVHFPDLFGFKLLKQAKHQDWRQLLPAVKWNQHIHTMRVSIVHCSHYFQSNLNHSVWSCKHSKGNRAMVSGSCPSSHQLNCKHLL